MTFTPKQLAAYREYINIFKGIAQRLVREGKAHIENGKLIIHKEREKKK